MSGKGCGLVLAVILATTPVAARAQGVHVALLPATQTVAPGDTFNLEIKVTQAGSAFNGFDAYIGYDPAAVTFLPRSPISQQEGTYFASACSNRFHVFHAGAGIDSITDVLLCSGVSLTGPGQIYRLHFKAASFPQVTTIRFLPGLQFYNAGVYVNPDSSKDATIGIGVALGVEQGGPAPTALRMFASPNPARSVISFRIESDRPGDQRLIVADVQGRTVRRVEAGSFDAGIRNVVWDCRNDSGLVVPPGSYFAVLRAGARTIRTRFAVLER